MQASYTYQPPRADRTRIGESCGSSTAPQRLATQCMHTSLTAMVRSLAQFFVLKLTCTMKLVALTTSSIATPETRSPTLVFPAGAIPSLAYIPPSRIRPNGTLLAFSQYAGARYGRPATPGCTSGLNHECDLGLRRSTVRYEGETLDSCGRQAQASASCLALAWPLAVCRHPAVALFLCFVSGFGVDVGQCNLSRTRSYRQGRQLVLPAVCVGSDHRNRGAAV
eukprot:SAG31_NODE_2789_length_5089_cov_4.516433_4_plen_223_part_00